MNKFRVDGRLSGSWLSSRDDPPACLVGYGDIGRKRRWVT